MSRIYLTALALVALAAPASGAIINFSGWGESSINVAGHARRVPTYFDFTRDANGLLDLRRLDVYNDAKTFVGYSFEPRVLQLEPSRPGDFGLTTTLEGEPFNLALVLGVNEPPRMGAPEPPAWSFAVIHRTQVGMPFTSAPLLTEFPGVTDYVFRHAFVVAPEPGAWVLAVLLLPVGYLVRRYLYVV